MGPATAPEDILEWLEANSSSVNRAGMSRFGMATDNAFGISNAQLRPLARQLGKDHQRALRLWGTGFREARLLALFTEEPAKVTVSQAMTMANDFNSWEIVDHAADLFVDAGLIDDLMPLMVADDREFVRRTAFAMIAWAAVHQKKRPDGDFLRYLSIIEHYADDNRNFVRKAVNWALRQIGKRSLALHGSALALAEKLAATDDRARKWIGKDALKELTDPKTIAMIGQKKTAANRAAILGTG